jgi:hypothetical protein
LTMLVLLDWLKPTASDIDTLNLSPLTSGLLS